MPYSARALGQEQLRLRSRRVRSNRSQRLSVWLAVVVLVLASLAGYFGAEITVSGLLTGQDLIHALEMIPAEVEDVVLPRGAFGFDGLATLDGVSAEEVGAAHPGRVHLASSPRELLSILNR